MSSKSDKHIHIISYAGIFTAVIAMISAYVKVPMMNGYVHIGDGFIMFAAELLGPLAAIPAAVGSMLSDLLAGFPQYILPSLIIKGSMGFLVGFACKKADKITKTSKRAKLLKIASIVLAEVIMVFGYHLAEEIIYDKAAAWGAFIGNAGQAVINTAIGIFFMYISSYIRMHSKDDDINL